MKPGPARDQLLDAVHRRALTLVKITDPKHGRVNLDIIIAHIAENLVSTLVMVLGESFEARWASIIFGRRAQAHGVCRICFERLIDFDTDSHEPFCAVCIAQIMEEGEELDRDLAMNEEPQGGVS